jgi:hypothetical protein
MGSRCDLLTRLDATLLVTGSSSPVMFEADAVLNSDLKFDIQYYDELLYR